MLYLNFASISRLMNSFCLSPHELMSVESPLIIPCIVIYHYRRHSSIQPGWLIMVFWFSTMEQKPFARGIENLCLVSIISHSYTTKYEHIDHSFPLFISSTYCTSCVSFPSSRTFKCFKFLLIFWEFHKIYFGNIHHLMNILKESSQSPPNFISLLPLTQLSIFCVGSTTAGHRAITKVLISHQWRKLNFPSPSSN